MELIAQTVSDFTAITASDAPAPGGGSISALAGSLAAALGQMVLSLTLGRPKYAQAEPELAPLVSPLRDAQAVLLRAVDEDSNAFNQYMAALSLPKTTEEEIAARKAAMQEGLKTAALVPLGVAERVAALLPLLEKVVTLGNPNSVTDGMVAVMMARTAVLGAIFNVRVNLQSIRDEAFCAQLEARCAACQQEAQTMEAKILRQVPFSQF